VFLTTHRAAAICAGGGSILGKNNGPGEHRQAEGSDHQLFHGSFISFCEYNRSSENPVLKSEDVQPRSPSDIVYPTHCFGLSNERASTGKPTTRTSRNDLLGGAGRFGAVGRFAAFFLVLALFGHRAAGGVSARVLSEHNSAGQHRKTESGNHQFIHYF
jgi:hypothetical protein